MYKPNQKLSKPLLNKEDYTKRTKGLYTYDKPRTCRPNPRVFKSTAN